MKKVILTGASGFVGRHAISLLLKSGYEVHAISNQQTPELVKLDNLYWHKCDLLDLSTHEKLCSSIKASHLLHFAWYVVPGQYWTSPLNHSWVKASQSLFINFVGQGGHRAVSAGSCMEYDWTDSCCFEQSTPIKPRTLYGICKNTLHQMLSEYSDQSNTSTAWGRIFFLHGPFEHPKRLIPYIICSLLNHSPAHLRNGNYVRDFLHVEDAASAFVSLLESPVTGPVNIASGTPTALKDIVNIIAAKLGKRELITLGETHTIPNEPAILVADGKRLRVELGWKPALDLEQGLAHTIDWWKKHGNIL